MLEVDWNSGLYQTKHRNQVRWTRLQLRRSSSMELSATTSSCYNWNFCLQTLLKTFPDHRFIFIILSAPQDNFCIVALYKTMSVFVFVPHAVNCVRFCFWHCLWLFCLCWTDLHQIHIEEVFGPALGPVWIPRSRSRSPETKNGIFGPFGGQRVVYVW